MGRIVVLNAMRSATSKQSTSSSLPLRLGVGLFFEFGYTMKGSGLMKEMGSCLPRGWSKIQGHRPGMPFDVLTNVVFMKAINLGSIKWKLVAAPHSKCLHMSKSTTCPNEPEIR